MNNLHVSLAEDILAYIKQERLLSGEHLAEGFLAEKFGVSRAPIRYAMKILTNYGILRKEAYRGHFLACDGNRLDSIELSSNTDSIDRLYIDIVESRLSGMLPEAFSESECMRIFNVSRHALRKALYQLIQDSIVARDKARGWRFTTFINDEASYDASFRFRLVNEPAAILEPTFALDMQRIESCRKRHFQVIGGKNRNIDIKEVFKLNSEFHEMLADFSGNPFFLQAIKKQNQMIYLIEWLAEKQPETNKNRLIKSCQEHLNIMDALEHDDRKKAASLMEKHLKLARQWKIRLALS